MSAIKDEKFITEVEVSRLLGLKQRTLQQWRMAGKGPSHIKLSERTIRYKLSEVQRWIDSLKQPENFNELA